jgi:hypothetical protein
MPAYSDSADYVVRAVVTEGEHEGFVLTTVFRIHGAKTDKARAFWRLRFSLLCSACYIELDADTDPGQALPGLSFQAKVRINDGRDKNGKQHHDPRSEFASFTIPADFTRTRKKLSATKAAAEAKEQAPTSEALADDDIPF